MRKNVIVESRIEGEFQGWDGETIFKLANGQVWQQATYAYRYWYKYRPAVVIYDEGAAHYLQVEGMDDSVQVRRIA